MGDRGPLFTANWAVHGGAPRIAVVGAGMGGLSCARELAVRGYDPVVFEASDRVGGRCSSRPTRAGVFDDGAQVINGTTRLAAFAPSEPGRLATLHAWTMATAPVDTERFIRPGRLNDDEATDEPSLALIGMVGVPSMASMAQAIAKPLEVRLRTPVRHAHRGSAGWVLHTEAGNIDEEFQALVVAVPAPLALPLLGESSSLTAALGAVRYSGRWVLMMGNERPIHLPSHREFQGGPIARISAMHSKPGQVSAGPQRWVVEASERWSLEHAHEDAETVADLMLANFQAHCGRAVMPNFLLAHHWPHACVDEPSLQPQSGKHVWDERLLVGVCGDSVVASRVDQVHRSGALLAARLDESLTTRRWRRTPAPQVQAASGALEPMLARAHPGWMGAA